MIEEKITDQTRKKEKMSKILYKKTTEIFRFMYLQRPKPSSAGPKPSTKFSGGESQISSVPTVSEHIGRMETEPHHHVQLADSSGNYRRKMYSETST